MWHLRNRAPKILRVVTFIGVAALSTAPSFTAAQTTATDLRSVLEAPEAVSADVLKAYEARSFAPLWTGADTAPATALLAALQSLPQQGLPAQPADVERLNSFLTAQNTNWKQPATELYLTQLYLGYARMVRGGLVVPESIAPDMLIEPPVFADFELLSGVMTSRNPSRIIKSVAPAQAEYAQLQRKYLMMQELVAYGGWGEVPVQPGALIQPGTQDVRIIAIRDRLAAMGDHPPLPPREFGSDQLLRATVTSRDMFYDATLLRAVQRFQERHGLNDDGIIGNATLAALNVTAKERLRQVAVNLERLRWRSAEFAPRHIYVNLPDFRMHLREEGKDVFTTRAVIGEGALHQTPEFDDRMTFLVANPTWTVPREIAVEELLPKLRADNQFLIRNDMTLVKAQVVDVPEDLTTIDWFAYSDKFFPFWLRQRSGPSNALGQLKFMFPNPHDIYLHDTPERGLFRRDIRDYSHGCIRLQDPVGLAQKLMESHYTGTSMLTAETALNAMFASGVQTEIPLQRALPVHLDYRTSWIAADGSLQFRQDVYGRDAMVYAALVASGVRVSEGQAPET